MADTPNAPRAPDARKQSCYFPNDMLTEIRAEAARQDRSLSWMMQRAWLVARREIMGREGVDLPADQELPHRAPGDRGIGAPQA